MAYSGRGQIIIPNKSYLWIIVAMGAIAVVLIIIFFRALTGTSQRYHPDWAPEGCSVIRYSRYPARIIVVVNDGENFDSEAEIASMILLTLDSEAQFFKSRNEDITRNHVEIEFPHSYTRDTEIYVQYMETSYEGRFRNIIRVSQGTHAVFEKDISGPKDLEKLASGDETYGFMQWIIPD